MDKNRPQGRQTFVTGGSAGVHRRGSGLNTGPVGSGSAFGSGGSGSGGGPRRSSGGGGGRRPGLLGIILAAIVVLGGGGGVLGGLFGGSSEPAEYYEYAYPETAQTVQVTPTPYAPGVFSQAQTQAGPTGNTAEVDTATAAEARAKYLTLAGGGRDTVNVLVYMCGTDLESRSGMATKDLLEMTRASWGDNMHVLVYTGGCTGWRNDIVSAKTNQIYEVTNGGIRCLEADMGQRSMTDPATLTAFLRWCAENYPANRNELIFWDHGGGSVKGFGYDEKFKSSGSMTLDGIAKALRDAGGTYDFIGFDACLMATLETGLVLDDYADYLIASEETEPGIGWYYTDWLTALGRDTSRPTLQVGKDIVDSFVAACASQCRGQSATLSVVDLAELSATAPAALKDFSRSLSSLITNDEYRQISSARNGTREFARSSAIDQIDLVDFADRIGTPEGAALAESLRSAVKYNRTSSDMSNSYGISIYFPYRKTSSVDSAIRTYDAIGMDDSYSQAIREFAGLELSGQAASGSYGASSMTSLLEALSGGSAYGSGSAASAGYSGYGSYGSTDMISGLLGALMGGGLESAGSSTDFLFGRSLSQEDTVAYIAQNFFDASALVWSTNAAGMPMIDLTDDQWQLVEGVDLNLYYDDGEGYIDLGLDNLYDWDQNGDLLAYTDRTWLALNGQPVAYYHEYTDAESGAIHGYVPAMLNGTRVELLLVFDEENPRGTVVGARAVYVDGETETVAKSEEALLPGDTLDFLCDYYTYDGVYENTYSLGESMTVPESGLAVSNVDVGDGPVLTLYRFTDIYQQHYWTPALEG